jgi:predicted component of type VI protein secretion system
MQEMEIPLEMMPSAQLAEDLAGYGFTPLICKPNRDSAYVLWAPMLHRPEVYDDGDSTAASRAMAQLPYQLFASRISQVLMNIIPRLGSRSLSADDLGKAIGNAVKQLIADTGSDASVGVDIQNLPNTSEKRQVELSIFPGKRLVHGATVRLMFIV